MHPFIDWLLLAPHVGVVCCATTPYNTKVFLRQYKCGMLFGGSNVSRAIKEWSVWRLKTLTHLHAAAYIYIYAHTHTQTHTDTDTHIYIYIYIYSVCVCVCVCGVCV